MVSWICAPCTVSPIQASVKGTMAAVAMPMAMRANSSMGRLPASAAITLHRQQASEAQATMRNFPSRSPSGP